MKKTIYPFILLTLLLLVSCKSKKNLVATLPRPVLNIDSVSTDITDTTGAIAEMFTPDHSQLKDLDVSKNKKRTPKKQENLADDKHSDWVLRGTKITSSTVKLSSAYAGIDRVVNYDFTHRDVPEAFEGFRIAFISDLHYKSLFKEQGLNSLVNLLIAQKADVLLMGGDYQEGCEYVEPLFAALSRVKTPMGTYGVMGNNDYERCHDDIVRTMEYYGMRVLEHKVDTLRQRRPADSHRRSAQPFRPCPQWRITVFGTFSQRLRDLARAHTGLYRRRFDSQHRPRLGGTYTWRTSPYIWSCSDTALTLRQSFRDRTGL